MIKCYPFSQATEGWAPQERLKGESCAGPQRAGTETGQERETERKKHTEIQIERKYPYFKLVLLVFIRIKTKWITIICLFNVKYVFKYTPGN